jgi:hypothetical protein
LDGSRRCLGWFLSEILQGRPRDPAYLADPARPSRTQQLPAKTGKGRPSSPCWSMHAALSKAMAKVPTQPAVPSSRIQTNPAACRCMAACTVPCTACMLLQRAESVQLYCLRIRRSIAPGRGHEVAASTFYQCLICGGQIPSHQQPAASLQRPNRNGEQ